MLPALLFGLVSVIWLVMGLAMIASPSRWSQRVSRSMADPVRRFLWSQGMILAGLVLMLCASTTRGAWLWMSLGALAVGKALLLLGIPASRRERLLSRFERLPLWTHRATGVVMVILATLLAIDAVRSVW